MDVREIERQIHNLEAGQTTYAACEKLAQLYVVRDHLVGQDVAVPQVRALDVPPESEFLSHISGKDQDSVWRVIDEHMQAVQALYPKEYAAVLKRIDAVGQIF